MESLEHWVRSELLMDAATMQTIEEHGLIDDPFPNIAAYVAFYEEHEDALWEAAGHAINWYGLYDRENGIVGYVDDIYGPIDTMSTFKKAIVRIALEYLGQSLARQMQNDEADRQEWSYDR